MLFELNQLKFGAAPRRFARHNATLTTMNPAQEQAIAAAGLRAWRARREAEAQVSCAGCCVYAPEMFGMVVFEPLMRVARDTLQRMWLCSGCLETVLQHLCFLRRGHHGECGEAACERCSGALRAMTTPDGTSDLWVATCLREVIRLPCMKRYSKLPAVVDVGEVVWDLLRSRVPGGCPYAPCQQVVATQWHVGEPPAAPVLWAPPPAPAAVIVPVPAPKKRARAAPAGAPAAPPSPKKRARRGTSSWFEHLTEDDVVRAALGHPRELRGAAARLAALKHGSKLGKFYGSGARTCELCRYCFKDRRKTIQKPLSHPSSLARMVRLLACRAVGMRGGVSAGNQTNHSREIYPRRESCAVGEAMSVIMSRVVVRVHVENSE